MDLKEFRSDEIVDIIKVANFKDQESKLSKKANLIKYFVDQYNIDHYSNDKKSLLLDTLVKDIKNQSLNNRYERIRYFNRRIRKYLEQFLDKSCLYICFKEFINFQNKILRGGPDARKINYSINKIVQYMVTTYRHEFRWFIDYLIYKGEVERLIPEKLWEMMKINLPSVDRLLSEQELVLIFNQSIVMENIKEQIHSLKKNQKRLFKINNDHKAYLDLLNNLYDEFLVTEN